MIAAPSSSSRSSRQRMGIIAVLVAAALLAAALALPDVRTAAAEFLSIFRAKRVQPVTIAPISAPMPKGKLDIGTFTTEQRGQARAVASAQEAAAVTGFAPRLPQQLPAGVAGAPEFGVFEGAQGSLTIDAAKVQQTLASAGIAGVTLDPQLNGAVVRLTVPPYAIARWDNLALAQGRAPEIDGTAGLNYDELRGQALALLAQFAPATALQLENMADWRTTLPVPVPENAARSEVQVDGVTGALIESAGPGKQGAAVLWQKNGILYVLAAEGGVPGSALVAAANSLQ